MFHSAALSSFQAVKVPAARLAQQAFQEDRNGIYKIGFISSQSFAAGCVADQVHPRSPTPEAPWDM